MTPAPGPPRHQPRRSSLWWLSNGRYFLFMLRELSAVFVALYALSYLGGLYRLSQGKDSYEAYLAMLHHPAVLVFLGVSLAFCLLHTVTWIHLTPIVMVVRMGRKVIPAKLVLAGNYLVWILLSGVLWYLVVN
ncbi:MAG: hypothetical protein OXT71_15535 [Acidobacteriota bacterium]|nr:hypothetical protein [Acidobacteriota bacterium]